MGRLIFDAMEDVLSSDRPICGAVFDLKIMFNTLPRQPVLDIATIIGIDDFIIIIWVILFDQ